MKTKWSVSFGPEHLVWFVAGASILATLVVVGISVNPATPAYAGTLTVNSTNDNPDSNPGNGICADSTGKCTLRAAIQEANVLPNPDTINFVLPGGGTQTITITNELPVITGAVTLNGTTQPGTTCGDLWGGVTPNWNAVIDLNYVAQLVFRGGNSTIRGLKIQNSIRETDVGAVSLEASNNDTVQCNYFYNNQVGVKVEGGNDHLIGGSLAGRGNVFGAAVQNGVRMAGGLRTKIQGNFVGTDPSGNVASYQGGNGIYQTLEASHTVIGGLLSGARNLISANRENGIEIKGLGNATVQGNYIGTDRTGNVAIPNGIAGIIVRSSRNRIGGTNPAARNIIGPSDNNVTKPGETGGYAGIILLGDQNETTNNTIEGNSIGLGADGTSSLGGNYGIIFLVGAANNTIGGSSIRSANIITNQARAGITTYNPVTDETIPDAGLGNSILKNSIYNNGGLGIDLALTTGPEGVTANDAQDADVGPNDFQNTPTLTRTQVQANGKIRVSGTINSKPLRRYRIEFFSNAAGTTEAEGQTYVGTTTVRTNSSGSANFTDNLTLTSGQIVTATATDIESGDTSEFSTGLVNP